MTTLHGDFWNGNMIYDGKEVFFIDFSRLGYGEA
ncbi:MAG: phosphotransferase [Candidatus Peribacteria bacterium]|nr:phosphotransferase [Candidatus Peribacteria bacterium]